MFVFGHVLFGLIIGSFLNVCILRHQTGRSLSGRSGCLTCRAQLPWYALIPLLSWIFLRGRCLSCGIGISIQYPLVEVLTGVLFGLVAVASLPVFTHILALAFVSFAVLIITYDMLHTIIPDVWSYPYSVLALILGVMALPVYSFETIGYQVLAGIVTALPLFLMWFFSGGRWMGLGDAKLALSVGWLLGIGAGVIALALAFVLGSIFIFGIVFPILYLIHAFPTLFGFVARPRPASLTMGSEVPFGPFIIASTVGAWMAAYYGFDIVAWYFATLLW